MNKKDLKWLYLDFNSYFATIEQQINPSIRKKAVAIVPSLTDYTCAIAASHEAKKLGIPKPVTKAALVGMAAGILTPAAATALDRIPFMSIFTGYGRALRQRLEGMR